MRCGGCLKNKPTRFAIFGKATGFLVVSTWEVVPAHLCEPCLQKRYRSFTSTTAMMGWWGVHSFGHALRFIPGNILEFRRTRGVTPLPADPTDAELEEAMESKVRLLAAHGGMSAVFYGSAGALVGLVLVAVLLLNPVAESNSGRTMMGWFGAICLSIGGLVIAWGLARRKSALHGDIGPLLDALPASDDAPAPRPRAARSASIATPTARTSTGPKPIRRRRR